MRAERVVVDTNVWLSGLMTENGTAQRLTTHLIQSQTTLLMSEAIYQELATRTLKKKFQHVITPHAREVLLEVIVNYSDWVEPNIAITAC